MNQLTIAEVRKLLHPYICRACVVGSAVMLIGCRGQSEAEPSTLKELRLQSGIAFPNEATIVTSRDRRNSSYFIVFSSVPIPPGKEKYTASDGEAIFDCLKPFVDKDALGIRINGTGKLYEWEVANKTWRASHVQTTTGYFVDITVFR